MKEEFELIAKTFQGLEEVLAKELTELGASNIEVGSHVRTRGHTRFHPAPQLLYSPLLVFRSVLLARSLISTAPQRVLWIVELKRALKLRIQLSVEVIVHLKVTQFKKQFLSTLMMIKLKKHGEITIVQSTGGSRLEMLMQTN